MAKKNLFIVVPKIVWLNYIGVVVALISFIIFVFVKPDVQSKKNKVILEQTQESENSEKEKLNNGVLAEVNNSISSNHAQYIILDRLSPNLKRFFGVIMAALSGVFYAFIFTPTFYVLLNYKNVSRVASDYLLSAFTGGLVSSILYFVLYCFVKRNKPILLPKTILPGLLGGLLWGM